MWCDQLIERANMRGSFPLKSGFYKITTWSRLMVDRWWSPRHRNQLVSLLIFGCVCVCVIVCWRVNIATWHRNDKAESSQSNQLVGGCRWAFASVRNESRWWAVWCWWLHITFIGSAFSVTDLPRAMRWWVDSLALSAWYAEYFMIHIGLYKRNREGETRLNGTTLDGVMMFLARLCLRPSRRWRTSGRSREASSTNSN